MRGRKILTASAVVLAIGLIGSIIGLLKEQWIASRFGIGGEVDVFAIALTIPLFVMALIGSCVGAIVIPAYTKAIRSKEEKQLVTDIGGLFLPFLIIMTVLTCAISWYILPSLASGFDGAKLEKARLITLALGPLVAVHSMTALLDGILNARNQYVVSSASTLLVPVGTIFSLMVMVGDNAWLLCAGLYLGMLAKMLGQVFTAPRVFLPLLQSHKNLNIATWKKYKAVSREFMALMFSSVILGIMPVIGQYYAASLPDGTVASLVYANKLIGIGLVLLSGVINAVVFPMISQRSTENRNEAVGLGLRLAGFIIVVGLLMLVGLSGLVEKIVQLIFERGAFTSKATKDVSYILLYLLPHVPFYLAGLLLARLVVTLGLSRVFVIGNVISLVIYGVLCEFMVVRIGIAGVGLALTSVYIVSALYLYIAIRKSMKRN
jgi:putative peptidoglycan lipid II flippase